MKKMLIKQHKNYRTVSIKKNASSLPSAVGYLLDKSSVQKRQRDTIKAYAQVKKQLQKTYK